MRSVYQRVMFCLIAMVFMSPSAWAGPAPVDLKCDFRVDPLGMEDTTPPFSWGLTDERPGAKQTAYQIQVSPDSKFKKVLWDSRRVQSRQSHLVAYTGDPLLSATRYFWRVRYWDQDNQESPWSEPAFFEMGLLSPSDWKAQWIQPQAWEANNSQEFVRWCEMVAFPPESAHIKKDQWDDWNKLVLGRVTDLKKDPYFRKEITLRKPVRSARLRYSALGFCEARINGQQVTENRMDPAVRQYSDAVNYVTLDVTDQLTDKDNAIGLILDDGWCRETVAWPEYLTHRGNQLYNTPALRAQLEVTYTDGSREVFATDASWKVGTGGLLASNQFIGELFDARKEPSGWASPGFPDADWKPVKVIDRLFNDPATFAQEVFPQREINKIKPISVKQPQPGVWVFELPETSTGYIELHLPAEQKSVVYVRPSEWIWKDGMPKDMQHNLRYPDGRIREVSEGMIVAKRRSSSVMSKVSDEIGRTQIAITTWGIIPTGSSPMTYKPKFSLQVMRYLEVTGLDFEPDLDTIRAVTVHNDIPMLYDFESSNPVLEKIFAAAASSTLQNSQSMSWDNSTERNQMPWPWTWTAPLNTAAGDFSQLYRKFLKDQQVFVRDDGKTSGQTISGRAHGYRNNKTPIHETPVIDLPWVVLAYYGDRDTIRDYYPVIRKYVDYYWEGKKGEDYLSEIRAWNPSNYVKWRFNPKAPSTNSGDHCQGHECPGLGYRPDSSELYVTLGRWINILRKASWIADQMDQPQDKDYFDKLIVQIIAAIRASEMRNPETGAYGSKQPMENRTSAWIAIREDSPTREIKEGNPVSNGIAVWEGIATEDECQTLADITYKDIQENYNGVIPGGREWYRALYMLSRYGYMDHAVKFMTSTEYPAIGYFTEHMGLTTVPESRLIRDGLLWNSTCQAESHGFANWFVEILCGIQRDPASPGMQDFVIAPIIPTNLKHASLRMESPYGQIHSGWTRDEKQTRMEISVPPNSTATVIVPTDKPVLFNDKPAGDVETVVALKSRPEPNVYRVDSGHYSISW